MLRVILNRLKPQTRAFLKNRLGSELEGAPQNKPLTLEKVSKTSVEFLTYLLWLKKSH